MPSLCGCSSLVGGTMSPKIKEIVGTEEWKTKTVGRLAAAHRRNFSKSVPSLTKTEK